MMQSNIEISTRLAELNKMTIPRSVKFLKTCLNNWWTEETAEISPPELFNLCYERAGDNGRNAFMRAFIMLIREKNEIPPKLDKLLTENSETLWAKSLVSILHEKK